MTTPLLTIPTEMLLEVATYLPRTSVLALLKTCHTTHLPLEEFLFSKYKNKILFYAAETNDIALLTRALSAGAAINHFDATVTTHPEAARVPGQPNIRDIDAEQAGTAISAAAFRGNTDAIEYLLQHGADPNAGPVTEHPIVTAVHGSQTDSIRLLLAHGVDLVGVHNSAVDLMWHATEHGPREMVELLLDAYEALGMAEAVVDDHQLLYNAVFFQELGVTQLLLERRELADARRGWEDENPPLYFAVSVGWKELVQALLDGGADPRIVWGEKTVLRCAAECTADHQGRRGARGPMMAALVRAGADINELKPKARRMVNKYIRRIELQMEQRLEREGGI